MKLMHFHETIDFCYIAPNIGNNGRLLSLGKKHTKVIIGKRCVCVC